MNARRAMQFFLLLCRHNVISHLEIFTQGPDRNFQRALFQKNKQTNKKPNWRMHDCFRTRKSNLKSRFLIFLNLDIQMPVSKWNDSSWHFQNSVTSHWSEEKMRSHRLLFNPKGRSYRWMWNFISVFTIHKWRVSLSKKKCGGKLFISSKGLCMHLRMYT